jgi:hypothetical protein
MEVGRRIEALVRASSEECAQVETFLPSQLIQHPPEQGFGPGEREHSSERLENFCHMACKPRRRTSTDQQ